MADKDRKITVIRGQAYDLTDFLDIHPGGAFMVSQAVGRDATYLFESYHIRDDITKKQLDSLPKVKNPGIVVESGPFPNDSKFYQTVKARVRKEVLHGKSQRGGLFFYILTTLVVSGLSYYYYIFENSLFSSIFLGFVGAHIGMTLNHCANHGGLTRFPWLNNLFGYSNDLIGASRLVWSYHHHISHHVYCNDIERDQDVFTGLPFIRFDRRQPKKWYNNYQHVYMGLLFPLLFMTKHISDYKALISHHTKAVKMIGATSFDFFIAHFAKIVHFAVTLVIPVYLHGSSAIGNYLIHGAVGSSVLAWLFAISHNLEDTKHETQQVKDWAIAQVEHSANYGGVISSFFTGGLNLQIEHHLFPAMAYHHYYSISKIVQEESRNFRVHYLAFPYLPTMISKFVEYMRVVGTSPRVK